MAEEKKTVKRRKRKTTKKKSVVDSAATQDWVEHRNQIIWDGGKNTIPKNWDEETGLKFNPLRGK